MSSCVSGYVSVRTSARKLTYKRAGENVKNVREYEAVQLGSMDFWQKGMKTKYYPPFCERASKFTGYNQVASWLDS